jgi:hypothetical protein
MYEAFPGDASWDRADAVADQDGDEQRPDAADSDQDVDVETDEKDDDGTCERVKRFRGHPSSAYIVTNERPTIWVQASLEVFEVSFADLSLSRAHTAGAGILDDPNGRVLALRFPRFLSDIGPINRSNRRRQQRKEHIYSISKIRRTRCNVYNPRMPALVAFPLALACQLAMIQYIICKSS